MDAFNFVLHWNFGGKSLRARLVQKLKVELSCS